MKWFDKFIFFSVFVSGCLAITVMVYDFLRKKPPVLASVNVVEKMCIDGDIFAKVGEGYTPLFDVDGYPIMCEPVRRSPDAKQ